MEGAAAPGCCNSFFPATKRVADGGSVRRPFCLKTLGSGFRNRPVSSAPTPLCSGQLRTRHPLPTAQRLAGLCVRGPWSVRAGHSCVARHGGIASGHRGIRMTTVEHCPLVRPRRGYSLLRGKLLEPCGRITIVACPRTRHPKRTGSPQTVHHRTVRRRIRAIQRLACERQRRGRPTQVRAEW